VRHRHAELRSQRGDLAWRVAVHHEKRELATQTYARATAVIAERPRPRCIPRVPPFALPALARSFVRAGCVDGNSTSAWPGMHADLKHQPPSAVPVSNLVDGHFTEHRPECTSPSLVSLQRIHAIRCEFTRVIRPKAKMISRFKENGRTAFRSAIRKGRCSTSGRKNAKRERSR